MGMRAVWSLETTDMFTAAVRTPERRHFLLVERLPGGGWDWIAWSGSDAERARYGVAGTAAAAMQAAESAAATLNASGMFFLADHGMLLQRLCARPN